MEYITYGQLKSRVEKRLDLEEEVFIQDSEFLEYTHDAIDMVEAIIHKFRAEDTYYETCAPLALLQGQQDYQLPSNIYANKIRKIIFQRQDDIFEIKRMTRRERYVEAAIRELYYSDNWYRYMIINADARTKPILRLFPKSVDTVTTVTLPGTMTSGSATILMASTAGVAIGQYITGPSIPLGARVLSVSTDVSVTMTTTAQANTVDINNTFTNPDCLIYYIRNAAKPTEETDLIDVPEWYALVQQSVMVECLSKEPGNPRFEKEIAKLEAMKSDMEDALSNMVPDQEDLVEADVAIYGEMS